MTSDVDIEQTLAETINPLSNIPDETEKVFNQKEQELDALMQLNTFPTNEADTFLDEYSKAFPAQFDENTLPIERVDDKQLSAFLDVPIQMVGGFRDAAMSIKDFGINMGNTFGGVMATPMLLAAGKSPEEIKAAKENVLETAKAVTELPEVPEAQTIPGAIARPVTQFASVFVPGGQVIKGMEGIKKIQKFEPFLRGIAADFLAFDEHEQRLSNAIQETSLKDFPALGAITEYLAADEDDGFLEGRMKNALEGAALGGLADGLFKSIKAVKQAKVTRKFIANAKKTGNETAKTARRGAKAIKDNKFDDFFDKLLDGARPLKETIDLESQRRFASEVDLDVEDVKAGKVFEEIRQKNIQNIINKVTEIETIVFNQTQQAAQNALERIKMGDEKAALEFFQNEGAAWIETWGAAKDSVQDIARSLGLRGKTDAVVIGNKFMKELANADAKSLEDMVKMFAELRTPAQFDEAVSQFNKKGVIGFSRDLAAEIFRNSILSSAKTLMVDTLGNPIWFTITALERLPAATIGKIRKGVFHGVDDAVTFGEAGIMLHSFLESLADGFRFVAHAAKEIDPELSVGQKAKTLGSKISGRIKEVRTDAQTKFDAPRGERSFSAKSFGINSDTIFGRTIDMIGSVINSPTDFMQAKDDVMKSVLFRASARARAHRRAVFEGLEGADLIKRREELMKEVDPKARLLDESLENNEVARFAAELAQGEDTAVVANAISKKAIDEARRGTFTDELGPVAKAFQNAVNKMPGGAIIFPFVKTPTKLLWDRFLTERTPVGLLTGKFWNEIRAGGARADMALGQLATGTSIMFIAYNLGLQGKLTGDGPSDKAERDALLKTGWRPRSALVGGEYIELGRLDPLASLLLFPANFAELMHEQENEIGADLENTLTDTMIMNITALGRMTASKSWLASIGKLIDAFKSDDPRRFKKLVNFYASSFVVPNAASFFANEINPQLIEAETLFETVKSRLNIGLPRRDIFGRPIQRDPQMRNFVLPMSHSKITEDETMQKMVAAGIFIPTPTKRIEGVQLEMAQHNRLMEIMLERDIKGQMDELVNSVIFDKLPDTQVTGIAGAQRLTKSGLAKRLYQENLKIARLQLIQEFPELQERIRKFQKNKATIGAGTSLGEAALEAQGFKERNINTVPTFNAGQE